MARQSGLFIFEGTLDNLTFYKSADGMLVRKKGGISKHRIQHDAAFARTRENSTEFGNCATSAGKFRQGISLMANRAKDAKLSSRLIKIFFKIKQLDLVNVRGARNVGQGLLTSAGKMALKGFDFNKNAYWHTVVLAPYVLDSLTGTITFTDFNPAEHLTYPEGATHFALQSGLLHIDLISGVSETAYSALYYSSITNTLLSSTLSPSFVPTAAGCKVYFLLIEFFQEVNGFSYNLSNGDFNSLTVIEVL